MVVRSALPARTRRVLVLLPALLWGACDGCGGDDDDTTAGGILPAQVITDLVYAGESGGAELAGDLYLPERTEAPPAFVLVHGGGFFQGDRSDLEVAAGHLQRAGVAVFNVDYRLVGVNGGEFPAAAVDVLDAVRYLDVHGDELGVSGGCGVFGTSAGGTLASLASLMRDDPRMVRAGWSPLRGASDHAPVLASASGVYDFTTREEQHGSVPPMEQDFLGGGPDVVPGRYLHASPIQHVDGATGPVLLLHGSEDALVEPVQAELMRDALEGAGVEVELAIYDGAIHGFMFPLNDNNPDGMHAVERLATFLLEASTGCPGPAETGTSRVVQTGTAIWDEATWSGTETYELRDDGAAVCQRSYAVEGTAGDGSPPVARVTYTVTAEDGDCGDAPHAPADGDVWTLVIEEDTRDGRPALFREADGQGLYRWFDLEQDGDDLIYTCAGSLPR